MKKNILIIAFLLGSVKMCIRDRMNGEGTQIIKYSFKTGEKVEVVFDVNTARECDFKHFDSYQFSPDGQKLLIATKTTPIYRHSYTAVHYIYPLKRNDKGVTTNNIICLLYTSESIHNAYRIIYQSGLNTTEALKKIEDEFEKSPEIDYIIDFIRNSERGIIK